MNIFARLFTKHPAEAGQTYWQHFGFAASFGFEASKAGMAAIVHALFPFVFQTTASSIVLKLAQRLAQSRVAKDPSSAA